MLTKTQFKLLRTAIDSRVKELDTELEELDRMLMGEPCEIVENILEEIKQLKEARIEINKTIDRTIPAVHIIT